ncbi:MAG: thioredoxin domain-containing protein [Puniceicoccaceae bacterium]
MPNQLINEKSLYLRQHAENPVDWYPWGEEAFKKAREEDKPVLVSIGYSSCHWCHVMAHESFEDDYIGKLMNTHFVCIKVDREERPDVDQIYMDAVQMLNGHGGWPLNVFCLPDGRPFAGGTYFPPDESRGQNIVPWPQLLIRVADFYMRQRGDLEENARAILGNLEASNVPHQATGDAVGKGDFLLAMDRLLENHDPEFGGFGKAPKFPPSMTLDFLLAMRASATAESQFPDQAAAVDSAINRTLTGMAHGGIFDQVGGGFARYSVDQHWLIPHFEKMLYDNALLLDIYSKAYQRYPKPLYRKVVEETVGWLEREMRAPGGGFHAALDADTDGEEGLTYTWTLAEVTNLLGEEEGNRFCEVYGITAEGNFENTGRSNPALLSGEPEVRDSFEAARVTLLEARNLRPQPGKDEKCLTAWNALLVRGLARAGFTFGEKPWLEAARATAEWLWQTMRHGENRLHTVAYGNEASGNGTLNDYTYTAEAFLALSAVIDWLQPGEAVIWRQRALALSEVVRQHFSDPETVGCFFTSDDHEQLVHRNKEWYDNATPSGNSSLLQAETFLEVLTGESRHAEAVQALSTAYPGITATSPAAASHALSGLVYRAIGIATIKVRKGTDLEPLRKALVERPWRPIFFEVDATGELASTYQLCVGTQCLAPTDSLESVVENL